MKYKNIKYFLPSQLLALLLVCGCTADLNYDELKNPVTEGSGMKLVTYSDPAGYPGVPRSTVYEVTLTQGAHSEKAVVFQNSCPEFQLGYMEMQAEDKFPLEIFKGRTISWTNFSFSGAVTVEVRVLDQAKVPMGGPVRVIPTRYGITPSVEGNVVRFTMDKPGQCSVEIGNDGYKNGLMIFANPIEEGAPEQDETGYFAIENATKESMAAIPASYSGIYFKSGIHDIGVYNIPSNIKNIYIDGSAWVYGSLIMDGDPNVKIFGRGTLSSAHLNYRESHCIEAINGSNNITVEGITVADVRYFSVRLIGSTNTVKWIKILGGWTYNCDGISAFEGSTVSNCFTWANDDNIKVYRDNITVTDMVCWQLNNGGSIQMAWGGARANNVTIKRVDILHAEWNKDEFNRGVLNCVGNKYETPGAVAELKNFLIEDLVTETPVPIIFRVTPHNFSPCTINGLVMKNWNVRMDVDKGYKNQIRGIDADHKFDGFEFDNVKINGVKLNNTNWMTTGRFEVENLVDPTFK